MSRQPTMPLSQVQALRQAADAAAHPGGPGLFPDLVRELAAALGVSMVFVAVFADSARSTVRTLAACLDGRAIDNFKCRADSLNGCIPSGLLRRLEPGSIFSEAGIDSLCSLPLKGSAGEPLGLLVAMAREPIAGGDLGHALAMLQITGARAAAEIERERTDEIFAVRVAAEVERFHADESRRQALRDVRQREEQYRAIFEGSLEGLFVWNEHLRVVDVNPAGLLLYGVRREEILGRSYPRSMPADYVRSRLEMIRNALAGATTHVETSVLRPDGSRFDADLRVMPFTHGGRPHALAVVRDITDRRRADQQLRDSEEQYRAIFNASIDALVLRAADFSIVDVNATYEAMSGFSRAEVMGVDHILANPPEVSEKIRALHHEALGGSRTVTLETQLLRRDGHRYELELRGVPVVHRGQPHVLYVGRDITQARRAERALRDSEEQYRAIFNASADALVLRDAHFAAVEVNPAYTAMSGYTREEVMAADRVLTQADPALRVRHRAWHDKALAGKELRFEMTGTRKDGSTWQAEVRGTPMTYRGCPHVLYAVRDITARVAAEQRRAELERQLRQAQKMEAIGQLTGGLAHDFNNILTSVLGYLTMAQEQSVVSANTELARQLGQAQLAAERGREHVAQLLAFSRPERGERRLVPPAQLLGHALQLLRPNLPASIAVDASGADETDPAVPQVVADPVQFEQVLLNLCLNARDAIGDAGTIRLRIGQSLLTGHCASCGAWLERGRWVWIEVADDGRGMTQDVRDRMFEPFFTTKDVGRGTGMGLAMVHGIVHDHGGHIEVASEPGRGSSFRVLLPAVSQHTVQDAVQEDVVATGACPARATPRLHGRVLLVDDEPIVGGYMHDLLRSWGLDVVLEHDPLAAWRRLASTSEDFALLLTDQTMPGMTGLALALHARQHRAGLPVLLYTGNASDISEQELEGSGVTALLRKPINARALSSQLAELLRSEVDSVV